MKQQFQERAYKIVDEMLQATQKVEVSLGLPAGFVLGLADQDDWTFVLRLLAILEAAIGDAIERRFLAGQGPGGKADPDRLAKFVAGMNLGGRTGKVALLRAFGLLSGQHQEFVETLAEVRNRYAHRPSYFSQTIRQMLGDSPEGRAKLLKLTMVPITADSSEVLDKGLKASIALSASGVLWALHFGPDLPEDLKAAFPGG